MQAQQQTDNFEGYFRIQTNHSPAFILEDGGKVVTRTKGADESANVGTGEVGNLSEIWHIQKANGGNGYTIMNVASGKKVVAPDGLEQPYTMSNNGTIFYIKMVDVSKNLHVISTSAVFSGQTCWHRNNNTMMVRWLLDDNSKWRFYRVQNPTDLVAIDNAVAI